MTESIDIINAVAVQRGIEALVAQSGENSRAHGFHDDWPLPTSVTGRSPEAVEKHTTGVRRAIAEKLALIHEEVSEALAEIRSGRRPLEVYYVDHKGVAGTAGLEYDRQDHTDNGTELIPMFKPEGFLVELADAIIRIADLAYLVGDETGEQLAATLEAKHLYNATRPYKHGRKF